MEWTTKPGPFGGTWYEGYVDGYFVYARVFEEPSRFGINDGRMTALVIAPHKAAVLDARVNYDCGWVEGLPSARYRPIVEQVFADIHDRPIDWAYEERKHREGMGF
ncbi:MAG: DUF7678 domain-containing protein [Bacilli bacterium]